MLALSAIKGYNCTQMDVNTAYLHADVDEELYMEQPEGFEIQGENGSRLVCKLNKSIYGLKQAGRNWNRTLDKCLKNNRLTQSKVDPCLYVYDDDNGNFLALAIYVDDMFCIDNNDQIRKTLFDELSKNFKMVDLGRANWILGTKIDKIDGRIRVHQQKYVNDILEKFGMKDCKPVRTPIEVPRPEKDDDPFERKDLYQSLVGSLIYLSIVSRPDISYAVSTVAQRMSSPNHQDWKTAKRILRYLKSSDKIGPEYQSDGNSNLYGYVDSDWGGDKEFRKSTTGYVFILGGAAISWVSKRQHTVALSSTEAEYMAGSNAAQEAIFLRALLKDLKHEQMEPTKIYQDNQGAIKISNDVINSQRTKHIDIRYHFLRERIIMKEIKLEYIPTEDMVADCLTKPVTEAIIKKAMPTLYGQHVLRSEGECQKSIP
jgi:hypothetical protein